MTISATPAELINNQNQQSAVSLDILERVTRSQPEPAPQGILGPPSEKVHTILITLRMTDEIADSIRRNVMRSPPDHAMVRRLISESCERATSRLRSLLKYPGAPDEIQSLPYLHQAVLRTPKRSFVEWAATGAAKEVVSSYCAIRDQHVAVPTQGELHAAGFFSRWRLTRVAQWGDFLASTGFAAMHSITPA